MGALHDILGVKTDATTAEIRSAYRRLAMSKHPDHGGAPGDWAALLLAHNVLVDPERRARYERDGDVDEAHEPTAFARGVTILSMSMDRVLGRLAEQNVDVSTVDMLTLLRNEITGSVREAQATITNLGAAKLVLMQVRDRFGSDTEDNVMGAVMTAKVEGLAHQVRQIEARLVDAGFALKLIERQSYRFDDMVEMQRQTFARMGIDYARLQNAPFIGGSRR